MFAAFMPGCWNLDRREGIANGVDEIRKAVRYQIKHGAQLIRLFGWRHVAHRRGRGATLFRTRNCRSSSTRRTGAGLRVAAHTHGAEAVKHAVACGIDCIEHGFLMDDEPSRCWWTTTGSW